MKNIVTPFTYVNVLKYSRHISFEQDVKVLDVDTSISSSSASPCDSSQFTNSDKPSRVFVDVMSMTVDPSQVSKVVSSDYNSSDPVTNPLTSE